MVCKPWFTQNPPDQFMTFQVGFFCCVPPSPYLSFLSKQLLPLPCLLAVPFLPFHQTSKPELPRQCLITQHCSGHTSTLLFWWLPAACLLSASPALPRWLFAGPSSSFANRCHFCLLRRWAGSWLCKKPGRAVLSEGQVIWGTRGERYRMQTSALIRTPELDCK